MINVSKKSTTKMSSISPLSFRHNCVVFVCTQQNLSLFVVDVRFSLSLLVATDAYLSCCIATRLSFRSVAAAPSLVIGAIARAVAVLSSQKSWA